jgi:hypothetical protein
MNDQESEVFESLVRGRLIYPFLTELRDLRKTPQLTSIEADRLAQLEKNYQQVKLKDAWFHSAIVSGDMESASQAAEQALRIIKEAA